MAVALRVLIPRQTGSPRDLRTRRQDSHFALRPQVLRPQRAKLMAQAVMRPAIRPPEQKMSMQRENSLALEKAKRQAQEKQMDLRVKLRATLPEQEMPLRWEGPRDSRLEQAMRSLLRRVRVYRCWKDRGPCAFCRATPGDQKDNRAARCGARPISDRYRTRRNRRGLAGCDNRCSRWRRRHAGRAQSFPILARDKHRCLLRPFADRDVRFADSGSRSIPPTKR